MRLKDFGRLAVVDAVAIGRHVKHGTVHEDRSSYTLPAVPLVVEFDELLGMGNSMISNGRPDWSRILSSCLRTRWSGL